MDYVQEALPRLMLGASDSLKFQKQAFRHNPEAGTFGDCDRTAIACLLGVDRDSVPHWGVHYDSADKFFKMRAEYLKQQGVRVIKFPLWAENGKTSDVLNAMALWNPGFYYLLAGTSKNGTNHVVIARDDAILWDPAIDDSGVVSGCNENGIATDWFIAEILI